jgi:hypothetical protein
MSFINISSRAQSANFLSRWIRDRTGSDGVELLDPEVYPSRQLERDERSINMEIDSITADIEELEAEANEAGRAAARASSDALERIHKQDAAHALKQMDQKEGEANRLLQKRGLILSIQHARQALNSGDLDLSLDEVLAGEDTEALAAEIQDTLLDLGWQGDQIEEITQTLDMNLPSGEAEGEYSEAVDAQVEQLKSQRISAEEFDLSGVREGDHSTPADHSRVRDRRDRGRRR